jgi:hypothetical protein
MAFEASVQQPAASAQVEPRDSRAAPQPNGRGVGVAARFPSLNDLLRALASVRVGRNLTNADRRSRHTCVEASR